MKLVANGLILRPESTIIKNPKTSKDFQKERPKVILCAIYYLKMTFGAN